MATQQEIAEAGGHLVAVNDALCDAALRLIYLAPEIRVHVGQAEADAVVSLAADVLKPAVSKLIEQLEALKVEYEGTTAEVSDLEDLLAVPPPITGWTHDADGDHPQYGTGGYL
jgi:hypothetical protein